MIDNDEFIFCPMIDEEISFFECMENRDTIPDGMIKQYGNKLKENWREICDKCKYSEY